MAIPQGTQSVYQFSGPLSKVEQGVMGEPGAEGPVAVLAIHGMGQQVPYETIGSVVEGLARADQAARKSSTTPIPQPENACLTGLATKRVVMQLRTPMGGTREAHVYEAYWAPLTEGKVGLADVMGFLRLAAVTGLVNVFFNALHKLFPSVTPGYRRHLFGRMVPVSLGLTGVWLLLAYFVLAALVLLHFLILLVTGALVGGKDWPSPALLNDLTTVTGAFVICVVLLLAVLGYGKWRKQARLEKARRATGAWVDLNRALDRATSRVVAAIGWLLFVATILVSVAVVLGVPGLILLHQFQGQEAYRLFQPFAYPTWLIWGLWFLLLVVSKRIRTLLVEYVGDVAAYVHSHKLDRFSELRAEIQERVLVLARAILKERGGNGRPLYGGVALVGHSLGSVIAYDTLNTLINEDLNPCDGKGGAGILNRTRLLLTYGSPLDKTAFFFTAAPGRRTETREALASLRQPLILKPEYRTFPWVNVYSPADVISSALDFYDAPENDRRVVNIRDKHALLPLVAHIEYDQNPLVWNQLHAHVATDVEAGITSSGKPRAPPPAVAGRMAVAG